MVNASLLFDAVTNGSYFSASSDLFTGIMGYWWVLLIAVCLVAILYQQTRGLGFTVLIMGIIARVILFWFPNSLPSAAIYPVIIAMLFGLAGLLYVAFAKGE